MSTVWRVQADGDVNSGVTDAAGYGGVPAGVHDTGQYGAWNATDGTHFVQAWSAHAVGNDPGRFHQTFVVSGRADVKLDYAI